MFLKTQIASVAWLIMVMPPLWASDDQVDVKQKDVNNRMSIERARCVERDSPSATEQCREAAMAWQDQMSSVSGTRASATSTYAHLGTAELEAKRLEIQKQQDHVSSEREPSVSRPLFHGKLTKEALAVELVMIDAELRRRRADRDDDFARKWDKSTDRVPP